jgi:hypothetical protein
MKGDEADEVKERRQANGRCFIDCLHDPFLFFIRFMSSRWNSSAFPPQKIWPAPCSPVHMSRSAQPAIRARADSICAPPTRY